MGRSTAGKLLVSIIIYFILLGGFLIMLDNVTSTYGIETDKYEYEGASEFDILETNPCDLPRFDVQINPGDTNIIRVKGTQTNKLYNPRLNLLVREGYINSQEECEMFGGEWSTTPFFYFWHTYDYSCMGSINQYDYNHGENYTDVVLTGDWVDPVCGLANLSDERGLCERAGCTWYTPDLIDEVKYEGGLTEGVTLFGRIWRLIKNVFTLRVNFHTESSYFNTGLNFFLIILPLIMLFLNGVYVMIR